MRDTAPLGYYYMLYEFNGQQLYSHDLRVEEYQKPTFFVADVLEEADGVYKLSLDPQYYFGGTLPTYDLQLDFSIQGNASCRYCRRWNEDPYYYNHLFSNDFST
ncbi:MAG: hypothetical protein H6765_03820 [Candidatus Peribacteria bacterium]|nr:MAG: hypothetical protein H6765_03820 [Candidatus Peribacteria bacterium]